MSKKADFKMALLNLKFLCDIEALKMQKTPKDKARGMLFLGALFLCANICACDIYFDNKQG